MAFRNASLTDSTASQNRSLTHAVALASVALRLVLCVGIGILILAAFQELFPKT